MDKLKIKSDQNMNVMDFSRAHPRKWHSLTLLNVEDLKLNLAAGSWAVSPKLL
jgi:hypothetical protein